MARNWLTKQLLIRPLRVEPEKKKQRKNMLINLLVSIGYSIAYGIFEYTVMYTNPGYVRNGMISPYVNWAIMYTSIITLMVLVNKGRIEQIILGLFFFVMFEDLVYHICYGIDNNFYPFPVGDWWDVYLASFRVLGNLGQALPFWPYAPLYYLPGFGMLIVMFSVGFANAKGFRIVNWVLEPFILAILVGLIWNNDIFAIVVLSMIPTLLYGYIITLTILKKKGKLPIIEEQQESKGKEDKEEEEQLVGEKIDQNEIDDKQT